MALSKDAALDAEFNVLGSMLIDETCVPLVLGEVDASELASEKNRLLLQGARQLYAAGEAVDALTILGAIGKSEDKELRTYCAELIEITATSANVREYIAILHEQARLRHIREAATALLGAGSLRECDEPFQAISEVIGAGRELESRTISELLIDFCNRRGAETPREYIGLGLKTVDANTFLERGDVLVIGGAPSDGKTAFALTAAYHMARTHSVGFYSLETKFNKLEDRLVASGFGIDLGTIKRQALTEEDWNGIAEGMADACRRRLTIIHAAGLTAEQIAGSARARGFDVIFIDYVQLVRPATMRNVPRHEQIAEISQTLHTFAQATGTLVVELAQLSRKDRQSKRERDMFDLGESSQLERDADLVLLLYRPEKGTRFREDDKDSELLDPATTRILRVAKQKEGQLVRLPLRFDGAKQRFEILAEEPHRAIRRIAKEQAERAEKDMPF